MKVIAGRLTDADRKLLFDCHQTGARVLVAAVTGEQYVGSVTHWDHDHLKLGGWSFQTRIPWVDCVAVWRREDAPPVHVVKAIIARALAVPAPPTDEDKRTPR